VPVLQQPALSLGQLQATPQHGRDLLRERRSRSGLLLSCSIGLRQLAVPPVSVCSQLAGGMLRVSQVMQPRILPLQLLAERSDLAGRRVARSGRVDERLRRPLELPPALAAAPRGGPILLPGQPLASPRVLQLRPQASAVGLELLQLMGVRDADLTQRQPIAQQSLHRNSA
jgi:hypothetical protein